MRVLLFTVINCMGCTAHRKELMSLTQRLNISLNIYDIDDPRYFSMSLKGMQKYGLRKTPSIVLLNEENESILVLQGIRNTLEKLEAAIHENRKTD